MGEILINNMRVVGVHVVFVPGALQETLEPMNDCPGGTVSEN